jgi:hypothetical protein
MIDQEFIKVHNLDPVEFKIYQLFNTELGHEVLEEMKQRAFFETPGIHEFSGEMFAYCDGRKSVIREILLTVEKIRAIIKENNYV